MQIMQVGEVLLRKLIVGEFVEMINSKKAFEMNFIGYLILGLAILAIVLIAMAIAHGKGAGGIDFIKNLFSFGAG